MADTSRIHFCPFNAVPVANDKLTDTDKEHGGWGPDDEQARFQATFGDDPGVWLVTGIITDIGWEPSVILVKAGRAPVIWPMERLEYVEEN